MALRAVVDGCILYGVYICVRRKCGSRIANIFIKKNTQLLRIFYFYLKIIIVICLPIICVKLNERKYLSNL